MPAQGLRQAVHRLSGRTQVPTQQAAPALRHLGWWWPIQPQQASLPVLLALQLQLRASSLPLQAQSSPIFLLRLLLLFVLGLAVPVSPAI